jgi:hypothetical protein
LELETWKLELKNICFAQNVEQKILMTEDFAGAAAQI